MHRLQLSQESLNPYCKDAVRKKSTNHEIKNKQNDPKYLNAIRPYIKERKNSRREVKDTRHTYASESNRSKSKKINNSSGNSNRKLEESVSSKQLGDLYSELLTLKTEYKTLKKSYDTLMREKDQITAREEVQIGEANRMVDKATKEVEKYRKQLSSAGLEEERIKKQCFRLLENERFKSKKLQQTIQEKDLMISYLRCELDKLRKVTIKGNTQLETNSQSLIYLQNSAPIADEFFNKINSSHSVSKNILIEPISHIRKRTNSIQEDSLIFSQDKEPESEGSQHSQQYTDNNLECTDPSMLTFTKKDLVVLQDSNKSSKSGENVCLTFENRIIAAKKHEKSDKKSFSKRGKKLQILTDNQKSYTNGFEKGQTFSIQHKKKHDTTSKGLKKPSKKKKIVN